MTDPSRAPFPDLAVIGGGLSGGALAALQAVRGRRVVLFERENGAHDKVCGEFLSHEAVSALEALGLDLSRLGAVPIDRVRLHAGRRCAAASLPFRGAGLSRRVLDQALLDHAAAAGARILRGHRVRKLERAAPDAWRISSDRAPPLHAPAVALATGKHDLREWKRPPGRQDDLIGFKLHLRPSPAARRALDGTVELHLFPGGYAGLQPVGPALANLCLVAPRVLAAAGWPAILRAAGEASPTLAARLSDAAFLHDRPLAVSGIPYGLLAGPSDDRARPVWRLGDQFAVIPSLTGDGMAIALHAARRADALLAAGAAPHHLARILRRDLRHPIRLATVLSRLGTRAPFQPLLLCAAALLPALLPLLAASTRIPPAALPRAPPPAPIADHDRTARP